MPILILLILQRTRAETRPHVATVRRVEISIAVMNEARTSHPTTAAKHLVIPKPGLGIFFVWTSDKAGIWLEVTRSPFPYVADHLPASERAIACRQRVNWNASDRAPIKICPFVP